MFENLEYLYQNTFNKIVDRVEEGMFVYRELPLRVTLELMPPEREIWNRIFDA